MRLGVVVLFCVCAWAKPPEEKVVLTAPVLAPPRGARAHTTETAKDFPVLTLLATDDHTKFEEEKHAAAETQPVYVKKLDNSKGYVKRRRRVLHKMQQTNRH